MPKTKTNLGEILKYLNKNNGNIPISAKDLGVQPHTIYSRLKTQNLTVTKIGDFYHYTSRN